MSGVREILVEAIHNTSPSQNPSDVKSLLGMTQYVSRFIPNYATITAPLRFLRRQDRPWKWEQEEQKPVEELKEALVRDKVILPSTKAD